MKRCIISTPAKISFSKDSFSVSSNLTGEDVRFLSLYWDKIVIPSNNLIHYGIPEEKDLIACGLFERPVIRHVGQFYGGEMGEKILEGQCEVARKLFEDKSSDWVIHQKGSQIVLPENLVKKTNTIRIDLSSTLPVPNADVPICDILEFKERRKDELSQLHEAIDAIYFEVLDSPDEDLAQRKAIASLKQDIENLNRVATEKFQITRKFDLSAEFSFDGKSAAIATAAGAFIDFLATGFTVPIATSVAGAASLLKVKGQTTKSFVHNGSHKLAFLSEASSEGIVGQKT